MTPPTPRYAAAVPLPPHAYVPGHDLPRPATESRGHLLSGTRAADPLWRHAVDLFNAGFYWEAHEAWEGFWNALGRTTPEARFVQGLIHLAAAAVKARQGSPEGVRRHVDRAGVLLAGGLAPGGDDDGARPGGHAAALGLAAASVGEVLAELGRYRPECWHTSRAPVVRVVAGVLRLAGSDALGA